MFSWGRIHVHRQQGATSWCAITAWSGEYTGLQREVHAQVSVVGTVRVLLRGIQVYPGRERSRWCMHNRANALVDGLVKNNMCMGVGSSVVNNQMVNSGCGQTCMPNNTPKNTLLSSQVALKVASTFNMITSHCIVVRHVACTYMLRRGMWHPSVCRCCTKP